MAVVCFPCLLSLMSKKLKIQMGYNSKTHECDVNKTDNVYLFEKYLQSFALLIPATNTYKQTVDQTILIQNFNEFDDGKSQPAQNVTLKNQQKKIEQEGHTTHSTQWATA